VHEIKGLQPFERKFKKSNRPGNDFSDGHNYKNNNVICSVQVFMGKGNIGCDSKRSQHEKPVQVIHTIHKLSTGYPQLVHFH
jgi:hypothetical protein